MIHHFCCIAGALAVNNPTPLHFDDNNYGATYLAAWEIDALVGGSHMLASSRLDQCIIVGDSPAGVEYVGDYRRVLHANAATLRGRRLIVTAYCAASLVALPGA